MKLAKSLLLGTVAGLAAVAGANAADLPAKKAAPVEYVRVCSAYGTGFFYIPGTETCLRVGGRVRAEYAYSEPVSRANDVTNFRARGRLNIDARTQTAYGLLRTFIRYELTNNSGTFYGNQGGAGTSSSVTQAFVQFGGLTAGRAYSFFYNSDLPNGNWGTLRFDDSTEVDLLAYTFSFGNGFSATLSLENGIERRDNGIIGFTATGAPIPALAYAGQAMPDVVGNLKYSGTWGTAQLSGAVHQLRSQVVGGIVPDTEYGFSIGAQIGVKLPMLAPGDTAWLAATYADGALSYLSGGGSANSVRAGNVGAQLVDGYINPLTGDIDRGKGWAVAGGLTHYWTPQIRQNVFGSYLVVDYKASAPVVDFKEWRVGSNLIWTPVSGLDIGVEVLYSKLDPRGFQTVGNRFYGSDSAWEGRLRVQRDF